MNRIPNIELYNKDCMEGMIKYPDKYFELCITDPPVSLYKYLLNSYANQNDKILDTHLGSGSIAIACYDLGFDLVGFEIDRDYYDGASKRLEEYKRQGNLFINNNSELQTG